MFAHKGFVVSAAVAALAVVPACSHQVSGEPVASSELKAATVFSTSAVPLTPATTPSVDPDAMSTPDMVRQMVKEVTEFWNRKGVSMQVPTVRDDGQCSTGHAVKTAIACTTNEISFNLTVIQHDRDTLGPLAVFETFAHETGHTAMDTATTDQNTRELRADCASGAATADMKVAPDRAVSVFNQTRMFNADMEPTRAFTTGFNANRSGQDVVQVCTTYQGS